VQNWSRILVSGDGQLSPGGTMSGRQRPLSYVDGAKPGVQSNTAHAGASLVHAKSALCKSYCEWCNFEWLYVCEFR